MTLKLMISRKNEKIWGSEQFLQIKNYFSLNVRFWFKWSTIMFDSKAEFPEKYSYKI